jgi:hypothetical protein
MSTTRPWGRAAALLATGALLVGGGAVTTSARAVPNGPDYGIAEVGECRDYTFDQAMKPSENSAPVDCSTSHTAQVLATPMLPDSVGYDDVPAMERVMLRACYPAFQEHLGRSESLRHRSAYSIMWFIPTQTQRDNGARWLRCDLVLRAGKSLRPLPASTAPVLHAAPLPDKVARCLTGRGVLTTCSRTHTWRATGTYLVAKDAYPGKRALLRIAKRKCPSRTSSRDWYATWASRTTWQAGDHTITCYTRTRR